MFTLKAVSVRPRSHVLRTLWGINGNAVKGALRRESWSVYSNVHRTNMGRSASGTAFPRSAWEREYQEAVGTITQELK
jgi:hypothetical protein